MTTPQKTKRHRHDWHASSVCGGNLTFRCDVQGCRAEKTRKATRKELALFGVTRTGFKDSGVHKVWHDFTSRFCENGGEWKVTGYDLMGAVREWSKAYPDDVRLVGCDDDHHASSLLVLVEHKAEDYYMGTTVVFIPQCTGEDPIRFFLYPGHRFELFRTLLDIEDAAHGPTEMQQLQDTARAVALAKVRP